MYSVTTMGTCGREERLCLPGEQRCGLVRLMIEVRLSPTCAFLSCCAGGEMKRAFVVEVWGISMCGTSTALWQRLSASWSPLLLWVLSLRTSAHKKVLRELYILSIKWHFYSTNSVFQPLRFRFPGAATRRSTNSNQCAKRKAVYLFFLRNYSICTKKLCYVFLVTFNYCRKYSLCWVFSHYHLNLLHHVFTWQVSFLSLVNQWMFLSNTLLT